MYVSTSLLLKPSSKKQTGRSSPALGKTAHPDSSSMVTDFKVLLHTCLDNSASSLQTLPHQWNLKKRSPESFNKKNTLIVLPGSLILPAARCVTEPLQTPRAFAGPPAANSDSTHLRWLPAVRAKREICEAKTSLLLVVRPGAPGSFLFLEVRPGDARSP